MQHAPAPQPRIARLQHTRHCLGLLRLHSQKLGLSGANTRQPLHAPRVGSSQSAELSVQQACDKLSSWEQLHVHVLMVPLVGLELPAEGAAAVWRALGSRGKREPLALHSLVVLSCSKSYSSCPVATDFLPVEPLAPTTALQLLQGHTPGRIRIRQLPRLPTRQMFCVAETSAPKVQ